MSKRQAREFWIVDSPMSRRWISEGPLNADHQEKAYEFHVIEATPEVRAAAEMRKVLSNISLGLTLPQDDVQRAIRQAIDPLLARIAAEEDRRTE